MYRCFRQCYDTYTMTIYIGSDHRGVALKNILISKLTSTGHSVRDCTPENARDDDYPDITISVTDKLSGDSAARGIIICASGVGVAMAANRFPHIRCVQGLDQMQIIDARSDDDVNVLALGADFADAQLAEKLISAFLDTAFHDEERHRRRIKKLETLHKHQV